MKPKSCFYLRKRIKALEAAVKHLRVCHQPPSRCMKCNILLAKAGMLDDRSRFTNEDESETDPFGS